MEHVQIRFELGLHGWSRLTFEASDTSLELRVTHIFDNPVEALLDFAEALRKQVFPASIILHDEPGAHTLVLNNHDEPALKALRSDDQFPRRSTGLEIAEFRVDPSFVAIQIEADLERIAHLLKHEVYQSHRSEFPWARFKSYKQSLKS